MATIPRQITMTRVHNYYQAEYLGVKGDQTCDLSDAFKSLVSRLFATRKALATLSPDHLTDAARELLRELTAFLS